MHHSSKLRAFPVMAFLQGRRFESDVAAVDGLLQTRRLSLLPNQRVFRPRAPCPKGPRMYVKRDDTGDDR